MMFNVPMWHYNITHQHLLICIWLTEKKRFHTSTIP